MFETIIRGYFIKERRFRDNDIIVSVDADEIIYRHSWPRILQKFKWYKINPSYVFRLNCFIYKPTWFWSDCIFIAPMACRIRKYKRKYPANWRYEGKRIKEPIGAHFTWMMTAEQMVYKLKTYAHAADNAQCADIEIMQQAINSKEYPFDRTRPFTIRVLDIEKDKEYFPDYMSEYIEWFTYLE